MDDVAHGHWFGADRFGLLLGAALLSFVVTPLVQEAEYGGAVIGLQAGIIVVLALTASGVPRRWVLGGAIVAAVAILVLTSEAVFSNGAADPWASGVVTALLATTPVLVLSRVLTAPRVTLSSIAGTLCAYLLVGMTFGSLYRTMSAVDDAAFSEVLGSSSSYLSFVTLTTLGFGDITPVSDLARSLVTLEAVLGQVLLVTLVARSVTTLGEVRERAPRR